MSNNIESQSTVLKRFEKLKIATQMKSYNNYSSICELRRFVVPELIELFSSATTKWFKLAGVSTFKTNLSS